MDLYLADPEHPRALRAQKHPPENFIPIPGWSMLVFPLAVFALGLSIMHGVSGWTLLWVFVIACSIYCIVESLELLVWWRNRRAYKCLAAGTLVHMPESLVARLRNQALKAELYYMDVVPELVAGYETTRALTGLWVMACNDGTAFDNFEKVSVLVDNYFFEVAATVRAARAASANYNVDCHNRALQAALQNF